jgi:hypothetical protein
MTRQIQRSLDQSSTPPSPLSPRKLVLRHLGVVAKAAEHHPSDDTSAELTTVGLHCHQELIGVLRWAVEIGRLDTLLEAALLSTHLALPRQGHLEQVHHIFGYLKQSPRRRLCLDPDHPSISEERFTKCEWTDFYKHAEEPVLPNMPTPRGRHMSTHTFVGLGPCRRQGRQKVSNGRPHILLQGPSSVMQQEAEFN